MTNPLRLTKSKQLKRVIFSLFIDFVFLRNKRARVTQLSAQFAFEMKKRYPDARFFYTREGLWKSFAPHLNEVGWIGFEFGVASGDSTKKILSMPFSKTCESWNGFDTFTGLPEAWGDLPLGAFSTGGKTPNIKDSRVKWHKGLIEETYGMISEVVNPQTRLLVIFDFDIYSATSIAWNEISKSLKSGDVIYFDEAYEFDESQIILEIFASSNFQFSILGYTSMGIAFTIN